MAVRLGLTLRNSIVNNIITGLAGTTGAAGTAKIYMYTGSQPATADTAPAGTSSTLLGTISGISWELCTGATAGLTGIFVGTTGAAGTVGWGRFENITAADGTFLMDGNIGTASTFTLVINNTSFATAGAPVAILTGPISVAIG